MPATATFPQVPFFLFIIFTVYTMLPFQLLHAVVLSVISSVSHIMVLTLRLTVYSDTHNPYLAHQVKRHFMERLFSVAPPMSQL